MHWRRSRGAGARKSDWPSEDIDIQDREAREAAEKPVRTHADHRSTSSDPDQAVYDKLFPGGTGRLHRADARREPAGTPPWSRLVVAMDDAEIKYSTVQNWYPGDEEGKGGIYNFVTKRGACRAQTRRSVDAGRNRLGRSPGNIPSCILNGDNSVGEFYSVALTNNYQQADTGTKMIHIGKNTALDHHLQGHFGGQVEQHLSRPGSRACQGRRRAQLHPVRLAADRRQVRRAHRALYRTPPSPRSSTRRPPPRSATTSCSTPCSAGWTTKRRWR